MSTSITDACAARKAMSPEAQKVAIGKACGWFYDVVLHCWKHPSLSGKMFVHVPDYLSDLNAMLAAVNEVITETLAPRFNTELSKLCANSWMFRATTAQYAEAFLRTLDKWEDGK